LRLKFLFILFGWRENVFYCRWNERNLRNYFVYFLNLKMARQLRSYDSTIMLYGFQSYTSTWAAAVKSPGNLGEWVHMPSKNLITLEEVLIQFPKLTVLVVDVLNDLLRGIDPLCLENSTSAIIADFYNNLEKAFVIGPDLKVSYFEC